MAGDLASIFFSWRRLRAVCVVTFCTVMLFVLPEHIDPMKLRAQCLSCPENCINGSGCPLGFGNPSDWCAYQQTGCPNGQTLQGTCCCDTTPIVIDVVGDGVALTDAHAGVLFDMGIDGTLDRVAWTRPGSDDAWLVLDRNKNGIIDNGSELFGNMASQPPSVERNGFLALAQFDLHANGGNGDGIVDKNDKVFSDLRLWTDANHDGRSSPAELQSLKTAGLRALDLNYKDSRRQDQFGNKFRYRAKITGDRGGVDSKWAWDVILLVNPPPKS